MSKTSTSNIIFLCVAFMLVLGIVVFTSDLKEQGVTTDQNTLVPDAATN